MKYSNSNEDYENLKLELSKLENKLLKLENKKSVIFKERNEFDHYYYSFKLDEKNYLLKYSISPNNLRVEYDRAEYDKSFTKKTRNLIYLILDKFFDAREIVINSCGNINTEITKVKNEIQIKKEVLKEKKQSIDNNNFNNFTIALGITLLVFLIIYILVIYFKAEIGLISLFFISLWASYIFFNYWKNVYIF